MFSIKHETMKALLNKNMICNIVRQYYFKNKVASINNRRHLPSKALVTALAGVSSILIVQDSSPNSILSYFGAGIRFLRSLKIGVLISLDYYFSTMGLNEELPNYKPMMGLIHARAATRILDGCLLNGGTYIKLGQGLVSLSHILPPEYIDTLAVLQDECLYGDPTEIIQIIKEDFGKTPSELFKWIEEKPFAAASISQVYKGETLNGEKVAIKVQYINLQKRFVSDVATIDFLLQIIGFIHPDFNFGWVLEDLSCSLRQELNFLIEAENSEKCAEDLKSYKYVHIPKVYWELCSSRFLVTEFIDAIKVSDVNKLKENGFSLYDIDLKISEAFGHQIFRTGFVHADPHPGNILIRKSNGMAQIVILDHGLYQQLEDSTRLALSKMWRAIVLHDFKEMELNANKLGVKNYEVLAEILTQRPVKLKGFSLTTRITEEQMKFLTEAAKHRFNIIMQVLRVMPRSLLLVVRNLNTIRSITHDHGDPIDRYAVLARCATCTCTSPTFTQRLKLLPSNLYFEFKILSGKLWVWCIKTYFKVLNILGRSPDASILLADLC